MFLNQSGVTVEVPTQLKKCFKQHQKGNLYKKPPFNTHRYNNKCNKRNSKKPNTCFRCGSEYHFIPNDPKPDTWIENFTGAHKSLKLVRIDQWK